MITPSDGKTALAGAVTRAKTHEPKRGHGKHTSAQPVIGRLWRAVRFPPPYQGRILSGRIDGVAYLLGWTATFAHLGLWVVVLALGLHRPWETISTAASIIATLLLLTIVIVIHRRMGAHGTLPRAVIWQWWLGPWDPVGRLVWLPVRLGEAANAARGRF